MTSTEAENRIKELADKEFLAKLTEIGKIYGWLGDYSEISLFINDLHRYAGVDVPDTDPYILDGD